MLPYKVFPVEDEIVAREGIRNTIDWQAIGFELCGEAADGEIALSRIEACKPDVLITDIKMPFMDGLQLSKIIREHMPWIKIVILSGYDEFEYAQTALKIGVREMFCLRMNRDTIPIESAMLMCRFHRRLSRHNPLSSKQKRIQQVKLALAKFLMNVSF